METIKFGFIKSPIDRRDFLLGKVQVSVPIPDTYSTDLSQVPILYQKQQPSCIGHATASGLMAIGDTPSRDFSPRFIYALCKKYDGIPNAEGTYYREAVKIVKGYGCSDNAQFPNDVNLDKDTYKNADLITPDAYDVGQIRIIKAYVQVDDLSFNGIKQAIYQNKVVLMGVKVGTEWWTDKNGNGSWQEKDILPLRPPKQIISGHAILCYGYSNNYIFFRNSFGKDWGRNGDGYFGIEYLPYVQEAWTFIDLPDETIKNLIKQKDLLQRLIELYQLLINIIKGYKFKGR